MEKGDDSQGDEAFGEIAGFRDAPGSHDGIPLYPPTDPHGRRLHLAGLIDSLDRAAPDGGRWANGLLPTVGGVRVRAHGFHVLAFDVPVTFWTLRDLCREVEDLLRPEGRTSTGPAPEADRRGWRCRKLTRDPDQRYAFELRRGGLAIWLPRSADVDLPRRIAPRVRLTSDAWSDHLDAAPHLLALMAVAQIGLVPRRRFGGFGGTFERRLPQTSVPFVGSTHDPRLVLAEFAVDLQYEDEDRLGPARLGRSALPDDRAAARTPTWLDEDDLGWRGNRRVYPEGGEPGPFEGLLVGGNEWTTIRLYNKTQQLAEEGRSDAGWWRARWNRSGHPVLDAGARVWRLEIGWGSRAFNEWGVRTYVDLIRRLPVMLRTVLGLPMAGGGRVAGCGQLNVGTRPGSKNVRKPVVWWDRALAAAEAVIANVETGTHPNSWAAPAVLREDPITW